MIEKKKKIFLLLHCDPLVYSFHGLTRVYVLMNFLSPSSFFLFFRYPEIGKKEREEDTMLFGTNNDFGKKMEIFRMSLQATALRRQVIADNIANADTPFFKRSEVTFESQLKRALDSERKEEFPALLTDKRHMAFEEYIDYRTVKPQVRIEYDSNYRNDKNNVDIDKEMTDATKNAMQYNALLEAYSRNIKILDTVMR